MLKDGQIICDGCQTPITRVTDTPAEGWPQMHNLCPACYEQAKKAAMPR